MKINFYILLICIFYIGCSNTTPSPNAKPDSIHKFTGMDSNYQKVKYIETILRIDQKSENSGTWDALFADKDFINIYEHSSYYVDSAIEFLSDEKFNLHQKTVCVYSMQRSELENYIRLFKQSANLFENEKIPELLLNRIISPTFGRRKLIIENYNNVTIKGILQNISNGKKTSQELKTVIEKILSGEYWNNIKTSMKENGETN